MVGPGYRSDSVFDLSVMQPYNLRDIYEPFSKATSDIALYLPRTSDLRQLAKIVPDEEKVTVIHYCMEGASKVRRIYDLEHKRELIAVTGAVRIYWEVSVGTDLTDTLSWTTIFVGCDYMMSVTADRYQAIRLFTFQNSEGKEKRVLT